MTQREFTKYYAQLDKLSNALESESLIVDAKLETLQDVENCNLLQVKRTAIHGLETMLKTTKQALGTLKLVCAVLDVD